MREVIASLAPEGVLESFIASVSRSAVSLSLYLKHLLHHYSAASLAQVSRCVSQSLAGRSRSLNDSAVVVLVWFAC